MRCQRKPKGITARLRAAKARLVKVAERAKMDEARARDGVCRFVLCPCSREGHPVEVSHKQHRGMGGNPALDRSDPKLLLALCAWRHKGSRYSVDQGGIRWEPVSPEKGSNGPIIWILDTSALPNDHEMYFWLHRMARPDGTVIIAAEIAPHRYYPFEPFPATKRLIDWLTSEWHQHTA